MSAEVVNNKPIPFSNNDNTTNNGNDGQLNTNEGRTETTTLPSSNGDDPERATFLNQLFEFMAQRGTAITQLPKIGKKELDVYLLYKEVTQHGGLEKVIAGKLWKPIVAQFQFPSNVTNPAYTLRVNYLRYLYPYERKFFSGLEDNFYFDPLESLNTANTSSSSTKNSESKDESESRPSARKRPLPNQTLLQSYAQNIPQKAPKVSYDYRRTEIPIISERLQSEIGSTHVSRKILWALQSNLQYQQKWALDLMLIQSFSGGMILDSDSPLFSILLDLLERYLDDNSENVIDEESREFFYKHNDKFECTAKLVSILRNLSVAQQNESVIAQHPKAFPILVKYMLHPNQQISTDARETIANLSKHIVLPYKSNTDSSNTSSSVSTGLELTVKDSNTLQSAEQFTPLFLSHISKLLYNHLEDDLILCVLYILSHITKFQENRIPIERHFLSNQNDLARIVELINHPTPEIWETSLKVLNHISQYGKEIKIALVQQSGCIRSLVNLLAHNPGDQAEEISNRAARTLSNSS
eukprot:TRINITY_DN4028_c0_g2_i1.p1 TRINITY_DN4028_c0_g2~~TRINITY_DN4028_c0_g2_i1.p1  ORF type:complete len:526 (-),score=113.87 TRINITY_DN4028_c0_g2_i1:182-1759(-)